MRNGLNRRTAVSQAASESILKKFPAQDFSGDLENLKRKTYPVSSRSKTAKALVDSQYFVEKLAKKRLLQRAFGKNLQDLGLLMIEPEMFAESKRVISFLRKLGIQPIFRKNMIFDKEQTFRVYKQKHLEKKDFPIKAALVQTMPTQIVVFRHLSKEDYLKVASKLIEHVKKTNPRLYEEGLKSLAIQGPQSVFDFLIKGSYRTLTPGTLREEIVKPKIRENIFSSKDARGDIAKGFDPVGFFIGKPEQEILAAFGGLHTPKQEELLEDILALLSFKDLYKIAKQKRRMNK